MPHPLPRICGVGGAVVDHYPDLGLAFPGGNALNVAVHAVRSGAAAAFLGVVGRDPGGHLIRRSLEAEGVDTARLRTLPGPTPALTVRRGPSGDFYCAACPERFLPFDLSADDRDALAGFDLVHLASTSRADAAPAALAGRVPISYDFGDAPDIRPDLLSLVTHAWLSRPGLADQEAANLVLALQQRGPRLVVVTRGTAGVTACLRGESCHQTAVAAAALDTLGAGDAFLAHATVRLLLGEGLAAALQAAAVYAAQTCEHLGAFGHARPEAEALPPGSRLSPSR